MKKAVIYIHGKGGNAAEAEHYQPLFPECAVIGFEYHAKTPWEAKTEFPAFFDSIRGEHGAVTLIANSIGAYFALHALADCPVEKAFLISPVVDMERLILDMMAWAAVGEEELREKKTVETAFGETLSWEYLCYARENPVEWNAPTCILYGECDNLTSRETIADFAKRTGAALTVMEKSEHWFHTEEQMRFLDEWIEKSRLNG